MTFTFDELKLARERGYSDDEIWNTLASEDKEIGLAKQRGYSLDEVASITSGQPIPEPEPKEFFSFEDAVSAIGAIPEALAVGIPSAYQKLVTGLEIPEKSKAIESELAFQERIQTEQADRVASGKATSVGSAIREALPSLGFSVLPMAAAIPAGIGGGMVGGPAGVVTGPAAAMAASGTVAYRMAGSDMMYRAYKQLEEAKGSPLTNEEKAEYYKTILPIAQNYGLWEAGPEAVSNAITMGAGKFVFGFGKQAAKQIVGESIAAANKTLARKIAEKGAAVAGGLGVEIASEGVTSIGQYPEEAKIRQLAATGEVSKGEPPSYPGGYIQAVKDVAPATIALYGMMGTAAGGAKLTTLPFRSQKTPEQIAEDNINIEADRVSNELSINETDEETKGINSALQTARDNLIAKKEVYTTLEPTDPAAQSLGLEIREMENQVFTLDNELKKRIGQPLSETITEVDKQQIELANLITAPTEAAPKTIAPPTTKTGKQIDPELTNSIGKMVGLRRDGGLTLEDGYAYRSVSEGEVGSIVEEGYMVTDPKLIGKAKKPRGQVNQKMFSEFNQNAPNAAYGKNEIVIRAKKENVPTGTKGEAVSENNVEVLTYNGNEWVVQKPVEFLESRNLQTPAPTETTIKESLPVAPEAPAITPAPVAETPAVTPAAEVAKPTGGIDYYKQLGEQDALDSNRKKKRAVPQNFKLAYEVGWSNARKKLRAEPTPAVSETITPAAEPAGISVGNRIKLGKSPQAYIVEEVVPQTEAEKANNEQFYSVKNERTGEVQVVEKADMKQVGGKRARKMAAEGSAIKYSNLPKENQKEADSFIGDKGSLWKLENVSVQELMENSMASMTADTLGDYDIDSLIKSISKEGVKQPITMVRNPDGSIDLEGNHRVFAAYEAGLETIPAYVLQKQGILKQAVEPNESVTPIPEANRYTFKEAVKAVDAHFGKKGIPEGVVIVNNTTDPDLEMKAGYFVNRGQIVINLAYIAKGENLGDIIDHELGHYIFGDPEFQADFKQFWNLMTPEEKAKADQIINQFYNKETGAIQMEEKQVRAFMQLIQDSKAMPKWKQLIDKIKRWINEKLGTNLQVSDRGALAVLAAAHKRFKSGEQIVREIDSGVLKMAAERQQIMGEKIGPLKKTPEGIIAETQAKLRERFDPTKVTEQNTTEAFRALGRLTGKDGTAFAQELNDIGRMVDESGAAAEVSMGAALFINDLFEYSIRLAAEGNKKMLGIMLTNINKLPTAGIGVSDAARDLRARLELAQRFRTMGDAEQDAFINYTAEFIYGPNPTKDQIQSIKTGYDAVEKVQEPTAEEVEEEIAAVGKKTGTDLVGRINEEFTKATEKGKEKRKTEIDELDSEYKKIQEQADKEIEKLAKIQSDTPSFDPTAARQTANDVRAIVANDLKQRPDMGRKAPWKSMLVAKLQEAGVEVAAAETLADIVWRQHEINNLSRELSSINKAIEKGPISEIVKAIKETPLEEQQNPNWRYEVMRDYLRRAGLSVAQAERIAKLMDISLQKRFTQAKEQAFTDAISKTAPWKAGDVRSKRAFQQVIQAIRAGALDPSRNMASDIAALNGWTGFSADQYKNLLKNDAILADPKSGELQKAEAYKAIQDIISKSKLPIRARDVIGQYYDAQALSGIPTLTVNSFSPIAFAMRNAIVEASSGTIKGDAKAIGRAATAFVDSIKSWANTVAFSFKNNVTVYSNVDYIVNDDNLLRLYRKGVDQFTKSKNAKERADGVKNMMVGMMDYVRRILNALDYGAIASLQNQNISKYAMAVMKNKGMNNKQANEVFAAMMKAKNDFYLQQIAIGTDKNKASILADEFYISSWKKSLEKEGVKVEAIKSAMDAAINDALSSVGRNRQSLDAFKEEATNLKDAGLASSPALWLLESVANAANRSDSQFIKVFSRVIYGFAIVPARVIRETAWFSPYGFVRLAVDAGLRNRNIESRYAQSLGSDFQRQQRFNEAAAGTIALFALMALRAGSTDDPEDEDAFKIVFTGNGPQRKDDAQFYDSWYKAGNKPNSMILSFGKTKFTLNMMRGFEAFTWPAMMLGALDDLEIRKKQKQQTKTPGQLEDAAIVAGFVFDAALRRGPYAFTTKSLFGTYGDIGVEGVAKGLTFPAKTLIPVLGTSLASNLSNFLNDPIDRRTLDGAVWSNIPFIGPAVAPKSLNAFGEPSLSTDFASKMFKLGVPIVYDIPTDRESIKLHELVLKQGGGPSIPTRNQLAQRLDRQPTNKEYEMFVREYGTILTTSMKKNYDKLFNAKPEFYSKAVERIGNRARDVAENKVRQAAKKP